MEEPKRILPADVTVNLLSRLPVKSICKFKCVCKEWLALISNSGPGSVKDLHKKRPRKVPFLLKWNMPINYVCPTRPEDVSFKKKKEIRGESVCLLPYLTSVSYSEVQRLHKKLEFSFNYDIACCHGLICYMSVRAGKFHICNPSTNELVKIPKCPIDIPMDWFCDDGHIRAGFGYLSSTDEYEIILFSQVHNGYYFDYERCEMDCKIFTLTDGKDASRCFWKEIGRLEFNRPNRESVCVEGVIYWVLEDERSMLAFDLEREEHEIIPLPELEREENEFDPYGGRPGFRRLIDFGGSLCFVWSLRGKVRAWALVDPKNGVWVPEERLKFIPRSVEEVVYSSTSDEGVDIAVSSWNGMLWYDSDRGTLTKCCRKMGKSEMEKEDYPFIYVESLFSLGGS